MRSRFLASVSTFALLAFAGIAKADLIFVDGNSMNSSNATFTANLGQLSHTFVFDSPANFSGINLSGYSAVWLDGFSQYGSLASLTPYLNAGGTVLIQNPGFGSEPLSDYPGTSGLNVSFVNENTIRVVNPGDPLNSGLTDANLTGWGPSAFGFFTGLPAGYTALSDDGNTGEYITLVRPFGAGKLIYTEQGISQSLSASSFVPSSGQLTLLNNALVASVPEPSPAVLLTTSLALIAAHYSIRRSGQANAPV